MALSTLALALVLTTPHALAEGQRQRVFLLSPQAESASPEEVKQAAVLVDLVGGAFGVRSFEVTTTEDVSAAAEFESERQALACEDDTACLAAIADKTKADFVVTVHTGQVGRSRVLSLALLETSSGAVRSRASGPLPGPEEVGNLARAVDDLVAELVAPLDDSGAQASASAPIEAIDGELSFAVLDLDAAGVSEDVAKNLTQVLSAELKKLEGATVIGRDDVAAVLSYESGREALGCADDESCLAEIGDALGVGRIVVGQVGKIAGSYVLSLRVIKTDDVSVESRVTETFRGEEEQLLGAMRFAAWRLIGLDAKADGGVLVSSSEEGAMLFVDGKQVGELPGPPVTGLTVGRHEIRVQKEGYFDFHGDIYVGPSETVTQWVQLEERPTPWYLGWPVWTALGTGAAAVVAVAAAVVTAGAGYAYYEYNRPRPIGPVGVDLPGRE